MSAYNSSYTGQQIDNAVGAITNILTSGGFISAQGVNTILGDYLTTSSAASTYVAQSALLDLVYPIGAIYMSVNSTSPATLFGGTWEQIEDTFLLSAGSTYTAGNTGGEATHTLTVEEMPSHMHLEYYTWSGAGSVGGNWKTNMTSTTNGGSGAWTHSSGLTDVSYTGGSGAHNNMPPYLVVYVWKRTA